MLVELAQGGEFFDYIAIPGGAVSESVARHYFKQLLSGLDHMHKAGCVHRDLKLENLMLDKDFALKIADFGFSAPTNGRDNKGFLTTYCGTKAYMAPELFLNKPYDGSKLDIFCAGLILFIMIAQRPPFESAEVNDHHYRLIAAGRSDIFWKAHEEAGMKVSPEAKDLLT
mmetsp:Transcript_65793/g.91058  ORF Transcript_65793/g.91058 Transcript_65793/m.91058 type:complete len:170 (+) Transcript_65793:306-815(+)|eukprot:CAMPEP_0176360040 /NCGR_PEP_ID=MMETSP0126-20121128/16834_1 /TAXON_ID=141414 ORGANISM="Strombidinopsis acuminatum, Strain SPMC142" /NCGR_SAMPLE_ID=MMETSP0126 /ASSEMBLY_ACC=CAM_ASM_000229 /LENGTH=169 /DNA_ID=CAMNT_0017715167 /DNA_START=304 /DNA_END=813 /DNA_ORIENTATION=-